MSDSNRYLLSLSIGPVQDFIAAALRTRDLWFGSFMLSEISKAAAKEMKKSGIELILPYSLDENDFNPDSEFNCANRIVGIFTGCESEAKSKLTAGEQAAKNKLLDFIEEARQVATQKGVEIIEDIWSQQAQPDDLLEVYCTGVALNSTYKNARIRLDYITAARKNSRNFLQMTSDPKDQKLYGKPKSSLDARRETILKKQSDNRKEQTIRQRLRMGEGEQLDLLGLTKRLAGGDKADQFTPTTRIAIDSWINNIAQSDKGGELLRSIKDKLQELANKNSSFVTCVKGNKGQYSIIPFDAGILYPGPLEAAIRDSKSEQESKILKSLQDYMGKKIWPYFGFPCPYYALILADGDHMGVLLDAAQTKEQHQKISLALSEFAKEVPETARNSSAHCIYAGGDDVLLMVPLDKAIYLADTLRTNFNTKLKPIADELRQNEPLLKEPTLSAGLVITHMQAPIGRVRKLAAEAEKFAKGTESDSPRNALGIIISPRSGTDTYLRLKWDDIRLKNFHTLSSLYQNEELPSRFAYELRELSILLNDIDDKEKASDISILELKRIMEHKKVNGQKKLTDETIDAVIEHSQLIINSRYNFDQVVKEHIAARWLYAH